jgi:GntR family transcriptional regulator
MLIEISESDSTPVYKQVVDQIREQIASGSLKPGEKLPSVRELANFLEINVNTVQKAYQRLKVLGLVSIRPARGAIVSRNATDVLGSQHNEELLRESVIQLVAEAHRLGFNKTHVLRVLDSINSF